MKKYFFYFLGLFGTFLLTDIYFQLAEIQSLSITRTDPIIGTTFKKNKSYTFFNEGFGLGKTNSFGYLGPNYSDQINKNTLRIAILGDSYVEGFQIFDRHHFRSITEKKLNNTSNNNYQVLNFGVSGFNLVDMYCYQQNFTRKFNIDINIFLISYDDLIYKHTSASRPFLFIKNDSLIIDYSFNKTKSFLFRKKTEIIRGKSAMLGLTYSFFNIVNTKQWQHVVLDKFYRPIKLTVKNENKIKSFDQINPVIQKIINIISQQNSIIIIKDSSIPPDIIRTIKNKGITVIDPTVEFEKLNLAGLNPFYWPATKKSGHWNQYAHQVVSKLIVSETLILK